MRLHIVLYCWMSDEVHFLSDRFSPSGPFRYLICIRPPISSDLDRRNAICDPPHVVTVARKIATTWFRECASSHRVANSRNHPPKGSQGSPSNLPNLFLAARAREEETLCTCTPLVLPLHPIFLSTTLLYLFLNVITASTGSCKKKFPLNSVRKILFRLIG